MPRYRLVAVVAAFLAPVAASADWTVVAVERASELGRPRLALDGDDRPHLAYGRDELRYAVWDGTGFAVESTGVRCLDEVRIAVLDGEPVKPVIAGNEVDGAVVVLWRDGSGFRPEVVAARGVVHDLRVDAGGVLTLLYDVAAGELHRARLVAGVWSDEVLAPPFGSTAVLDRDGAPWLLDDVWDGPTIELRSARWDGVAGQLRTWDTIAVADGRFYPLQMVFDEGNAPFAIYGRDAATVPPYAIVVRPCCDVPDGALVVSHTFTARGGSAVGALGYGGPLEYWDGAVREVIDPAPSDAKGAVAFTAAGDAVVAYRRPGEVAVAFATGGGWDLHVADTGGARPGPPELRASVVVYTDVGRHRLMAARDRGVWEREIVAELTAVDAGPRPRLAFDGDGQPAVAFVDAGALLIARSVGPTWLTPEAVPGAAPGIEALALAFDRGGEPVVAYEVDEIGTDDIHVARRAAGSWVIEVVEPNGEEPSIAIDGAGRIRIAYYQSFLRNLATVTWDGSRWAYETIVEAGRTGLHPAAAIDGSGKLAIAYWNGDGAALELALDDGAGWTFTTVATGVAHPFPDLAFDRDGWPAVAYLDRVARDRGAGWVHDRVAAASGATSLAFATSGQPYVALIDGGCAADLRVATVAGDAVLYRSRLDVVAPGWKVGRLPLTADTDDEDAPFPIAVALPGSIDDTAPDGAALTLYRALWSDGSEAMNTLRLVRGGAAVRIEF